LTGDARDRAVAVQTDDGRYAPACPTNPHPTSGGGGGSGRTVVGASRVNGRLVSPKCPSEPTKQSTRWDRLDCNAFGVQRGHHVLPHPRYHWLGLDGWVGVGENVRNYSFAQRDNIWLCKQNSKCFNCKKNNLLKLLAHAPVHTHTHTGRKPAWKMISVESLYGNEYYL
jgi:hypothetical protein